MTRQAVNYLIGAAAKVAGLKNVPVQHYLGHRDPRHTVHYTRVSGRRFERLRK